MSDFEETYKDAHASGLLPGVVLLASAREGTAFGSYLIQAVDAF